VSNATGRALFPNGNRPSLPFLLPYLELQGVAAKFNFGINGGTRIDWDNAVNQPAYQTQVRVFQCPTAEANRTDTFGTFVNAACGDYQTMNNVEITGTCAYTLGYIPFVITDATRGGMLENNGKRRLIDTVNGDGTSNTLAYVEDCGRPQVYARGRLVSGGTSGGAWADNEGQFSLHGFSYDGLTQGGPCAVNCSNRNEIFSFHPGGCNVSLGDGSVRFLRETIDIAVVAMLVTRNNGEVVVDTDF
jgi:prepilin-type processing-associated H-X9-DG protein